MEERRRVGGLDQRRRVEPAIAIAGPAAERQPRGQAPKPPSTGTVGSRRSAGVSRRRRDADVEHAVEAALVERGGVAMAERAGARASLLNSSRPRSTSGERNVTPMKLAISSSSAA